MSFEVWMTITMTAFGVGCYFVGRYDEWTRHRKRCSCKKCYKWRNDED